MTKKEKEIQIALGTYLNTMWAKRCKMRGQGTKLHEKAAMFAYQEKFALSEQYSCLAGVKCVRANLIFAAAVREVYGDNMRLRYDSSDNCILENGIKFHYA